MTTDWGNVPAWISAVGGITATVAAIFAARFTWKALERERKRDEDRETRDIQAQAQTVAGWIMDAYLTDHPTWMARVENRSALPIYDLRIKVTMRPGWDPAQYMVLDDGHAVAVAPGQSHYEIARDEETSHRSVSDLRIQIAFSDSAGERWCRTPDGLLYQWTPTVEGGEWRPTVRAAGATRR